MTAAAATKSAAIAIDRADLSAPILVVTGRGMLAIRAGTVVRIGGNIHAFDTETPVSLAAPVPGINYGVHIDGGIPAAVPLDARSPIPDDIFAGFHFAPGGNAAAREGGDDVPNINPFSCWDTGFRPACPDPRGMALIDGRFWADIYLLGVDHLATGTSSCGTKIADGIDRPVKPDGSGKVERLDYATAVAIYAHHGKQLLGAEEFFAAAFGVKERCSRDDEPTKTGALDDGASRFISRHGLFDVTGTMWQWGTDGDPDEPRASIFGGSWIDGDYAGSRYADLGLWPEFSLEFFSARGRSDHLTPA